MRIFGKSDRCPTSTVLAEALESSACTLQLACEPTNDDWRHIEVLVREQETPIYLDRFHRTDEGIRGELQAWAAWLETCDYSPNHQSLMTHMIQTQQVFTVRKPVDCANEVLIDNVSVAICQFLAQAADGIYQIDGKGFFAPDGTMLLQEF